MNKTRTRKPSKRVKKILKRHEILNDNKDNEIKKTSKKNISQKKKSKSIKKEKKSKKPVEKKSTLSRKKLSEKIKKKEVNKKKRDVKTKLAKKIKKKDIKMTKPKKLKKKKQAIKKPSTNPSSNKPSLSDVEKIPRLSQDLAEQKKIWKKFSIAKRIEWIQEMTDNNKLNLEDRVSCIGLLSFLLSNFFSGESKRREFADYCQEKCKPKLYNNILDLMVDSSDTMILDFIDELVQEKENIIYQKQIKKEDIRNGEESKN